MQSEISSSRCRTPMSTVTVTSGFSAFWMSTSGRLESSRCRLFSIFLARLSSSSTSSLQSEASSMASMIMKVLPCLLTISSRASRRRDPSTRRPLIQWRIFGSLTANGSLWSSPQSCVIRESKHVQISFGLSLSELKEKYARPSDRGFVCSMCSTTLALRTNQSSLGK